MGKMVAQSWFGSLWKTSPKNGSERAKPEKLVIGVLSFEVASLMSKVVHLWRSLGDDEVVRLREEIMCSTGIRKLVSDDEDYLVGLVCAETIDNLRFVFKAVGRIGKKCADPVLQRFENVFDDLMKNGGDLSGWEFSWKKMDKKTRRLERYVRNTASLYRQMVSFNELELDLKRGQGTGDLVELQKKLVWQRQEVKSLREISLWNKTYDYILLLLARSLVTLFRRINHVFDLHQSTVRDFSDLKVMNTGYLPRSRSISALRQMSVHPAENGMPRFSSGPLGKSTTKSGPLGRPSSKSGPISRTQDYSSNLHGKPPRLKTKRFAPAGPFKGCIMGGNKSPVLHSYAPVISDHVSSDGVYSGTLIGTKGVYAGPPTLRNTLRANLGRCSSKCRLMDAPPSTLGASALAHHYAHVITEIEKYVESPHLIDGDARDYLYSMLPTSIKAALRAKLKSLVRDWDSFYSDTDLAAEWSEASTRIITWLAPLAHGMIRWQSERGFQQQQLASRTSVLLVQTLFFADQAKTEAAITELLLGLNYLWRFGRELNEKAYQECASSMEFDDYLDSKG